MQQIPWIAKKRGGKLLKIIRNKQVYILYTYKNKNKTGKIVGIVMRRLKLQNLVITGKLKGKRREGSHERNIPAD